MVSGALLFGLGGPAESGDPAVGAWLGSPVLSLCVSTRSMFDLTAGDLPPTHDPADPRTPCHTPWRWEFRASQKMVPNFQSFTSWFMRSSLTCPRILPFWSSGTLSPGPHSSSLSVYLTPNSSHLLYPCAGWSGGEKWIFTVSESRLRSQDTCLFRTLLHQGLLHPIPLFTPSANISWAPKCAAHCPELCWWENIYSTMV